ncbi:hypothetical protein PAPYR_9093 [Paratrimastix pyriformis]|uniref:Uncharacterized protein n=1 Tax=Paratrimastix pyriformis TaxID=342808 RepID=A0ABQ8UDZ9_9EUKA|nr:hypothetical protein PAPYR_9093 [Paratrimastix pyriformis]
MKRTRERDTASPGTRCRHVDGQEVRINRGSGWNGDWSQELLTIRGRPTIKSSPSPPPRHGFIRSGCSHFMECFFEDGILVGENHPNSSMRKQVMQIQWL